MEKMDFRKLSSEQRYILRLRGINLIKSGETQKKVASIFGVRTSTVNSWVKSYKEEGLRGLKDKSRGVKSEDKKLLSAKLEKEHSKNDNGHYARSVKASLCIMDKKSC